jgi:hypothetical protein
MTEYGELRFKIVGVETAGQEALARLSDLIVARRHSMFPCLCGRVPGLNFHKALA